MHSQSLDKQGEYFSRDFFSRYYFPALLRNPSELDEVDSNESEVDSDELICIVSLLEKTRVFARVLLVSSINDLQCGFPGGAVAVVLPDEGSDCEGPDPQFVIRRVRFRVFIVSRERSFKSGMGRLRVLSRIVRRAVEGAKLGANCVPALTFIFNSEYVRTVASPEHGVMLRGQFCTLID